MQPLPTITNFANRFLLKKSSLYALLLIAFACNLSSHTFAYWPGDNWWLRSGYWLLYLSLALGFIYGAYYVLEKLHLPLPKKYLFLIAIVVSGLPFGLAIAMLDIATGRPNSTYILQEIHNIGFFNELLAGIGLNFLPRHLIFGLLLFLIHFYVRIDTGSVTTEPAVDSVLPPLEGHNKPHSPPVQMVSFIYKLPKEIQAQPQLLQAQEHYLNVVTSKGQALILYKFGQALQDLSEYEGLQIHRSFWVAKCNIIGWTVSDSNMSIILHHGQQAPVSRRFEHTIKQQFTEVTT